MHRRSSAALENAIWFLLATLLLSTACAHQKRRLVNDAYIWQRSWNDPLLASLKESAPLIQQWRVLAAEADPGTNLVKISINRRVLQELGKPVVAVIRIDGRIGPDRLDSTLALQSSALVSEWRKDGVPVRAIEIDYDCATSRLLRYRDFLRLLRARMPKAVKLSITALPSWIAGSHLLDVLAQVDEAVLQVHSVRAPSMGLFDRDSALHWVQAWSAISPVPFRVALPTYWSRVEWNQDGRVVSIESEAKKYGTDPVSRELVVQPFEVSSLVVELRRARFRNLAGIAWFRLPTALDQRAWSSRTWHAVMQGQTLSATLPVVHFQSDHTGVTDVYLFNNTSLDVRLPAQVLLSSNDCEFADSMPPYNFEQQPSGVRFVLHSEGLLRAGQKRLIGWLRCVPGELHAHVSY